MADTTSTGFSMAAAAFFYAAAAKSLQSCSTLCDPIYSSPPGSSVPGILQERTLEWVAISFSNAWKWKVKVKSLSRVWLFPTPWTAAHQAPPSMGFSRQGFFYERCTNKNYELNCLSLKFIMATHSSILAWRIPWTGESGRLQFIGSKRSNMTEQLSKFICLCTNSQYLGMWLYLEIGFWEI